MKKTFSWIGQTFDALLLRLLLRFNIRIPLPERNPFQLIVLVSIAVTTGLLLGHVNVSGPASLDTLGLAGQIVVWGIAIGATFGIVGLVIRDREIGLAVEQYAHAVLCFASWGYVIAAVGYNGLSSSIILVGYTAGVAVGAWARAMHILLFGRQIKALTRNVRVPA